MVKEKYKSLMMAEDSKIDTLAQDIADMIVENDLDGETMQAILEMAGMDEQMYTQLTVLYDGR